MPQGNLAASLLVHSSAPAATGASLGFVAGLALDRALGALIPDTRIEVGLDAANPGHGASGRERLALKWPNDVTAGGAKIAGILVESIQTARGAAFVIGFGVNVAQAPEGLPYAATSLRQLGADIGANRVFDSLSEAWPHFFEIWNHGAGLPLIRDLWLGRASGIGAPVAVRLSDGAVIRGRFETIDDAGRLVVCAEDGARRTVSAGEVHFGAAASVAPGALAG